jgi:hypothetical protein
MAAIVAPLGYTQFGSVGLNVVAAFTASIVISVWIATWGATKVSRKHPALAGLFSSSGVRMVPPLIIALAVVATRGRIAPVETVYYVLPLYLSMLLVDVIGWVRESNRSTPANGGCVSHGSSTTSELG